MTTSLGSVALGALLVALVELKRELFPGLPSHLLGHPDQPCSFRDFTVSEIEEAERFLMRCGLLRRIPNNPGTAR